MAESREPSFWRWVWRWGNVASVPPWLVLMDSFMPFKGFWDFAGHAALSYATALPLGAVFVVAATAVFLAWTES